MNNNIDKSITDLSISYIGPVLFDYVCWILLEAQKRNINTIYFLARDGYLLCEIAKRVSISQHIPIGCRYLYCSRTALRLPSYYLIGEEAYDLLLMGSYRISRHSILDRISLNQDQREQIYAELGYSLETENNLLNYNEFSAFTRQLRKCQSYKMFMDEKSKEAYSVTLGYLKQEGVLDQKHVAIADSGWTGTMQRTLRQLLSSAGYSGRITGFYFGMFHPIKREPSNSNFCCWYFNESSGFINKLLFNNNLFECFLSALHGMTLTYEYADGQYIPVLKAVPNEEMLHYIKLQIDTVILFTEQRLCDFSLESFNYKKARKQTAHALKRIMVKPTMQEVIAYGRFFFSDDIMEQNPAILASAEQLNELYNNYLIFPRIFRKITGKSKYITKKELFWPYGTAVFAHNPLMVTWYRLNIFLWDFCRDLVHHR